MCAHTPTAMHQSEREKCISRVLLHILCETTVIFQTSKQNKWFFTLTRILSPMLFSHTSRKSSNANKITLEDKLMFAQTANAFL